MGATDLNTVAINMGKVLKLIEDIEPKAYNCAGVREQREEFMFVAYICRVGIYDIIECNNYMMLNPLIPIRIPLSMFRSRKETLMSALTLTVGKLKELVAIESGTAELVESILNKGQAFYELEKMLPKGTRERFLQ